MAGDEQLRAQVAKAVEDADAARVLAAAAHEEVGDLGGKVTGLQRAVDRLSLQTAERFDRVDERMDRMDQRLDRIDEQMGAQRWALNELTGQTAERFASMDRRMRRGFAQTAEGMRRITDMIDVLIARDSGAGGGE